MKRQPRRGSRLPAVVRSAARWRPETAATDVEAGELVCDGCGRALADRRRRSRASFRPISSSSSERRQRRSAGSGSTSPRCIQSSKRSSSTGCIRSSPSSSAASASSTRAAGRAGMRTSPRRTVRARSSHSTSAVRWRQRVAISRGSTTSRSSRAICFGRRSGRRRRGRRVRPRLLDRRSPPSSGPVRRISERCSDTCVRAGRSRSGCTGTRTTASCATSSSRSGACRRGFRRPFCVVSRGPSRSDFTAPRRGSIVRSARQALGGALPLREYMSSVAEFSFRQNYGIVFDQLVAPTAAYLARAEVERWFDESGLEDVEISHRHGNSWRARGTVSA